MQEYNVRTEDTDGLDWNWWVTAETPTHAILTALEEAKSQGLWIERVYVPFPIPAQD